MRTFAIMVVAVALVASVAFAGSKTSQFTGKVLEIKDNVIVVEKGKEKFEMTKDANTKSRGTSRSARK